MKLPSPTLLTPRPLRVPILLYHSLDADNPFGAVRPQAFEQQMALLREKFNPISLEALLRALAGSAAPTPNAVVVTFDDGYRNNLEHAQPILQHYNIPAIVFVVSDFVGGDNAFDRARAAPRRLLMSWSDLEEWSRAGLQVGAHGCGHRALRTLSLETAETEIRRSKHHLEDRLQTPIQFFAYPYGQSQDYAREHVRLVEAAGYLGACCTRWGTRQSWQRRFELARIRVDFDDTLRRFENKVNGGEDWHAPWYATHGTLARMKRAVRARTYR